MSPWYALSSVDHDGRAYAPGEPVAFTAAQLERYRRDQGGPIGELLKAKAIGPAPVAPAAPVASKPHLTVIEHDRNGLGPLAGPQRQGDWNVERFRI